MVECVISLDSIFNSLSDPTRRDILQRVSIKELSVGQIAKNYGLTFAAISKHIKVLEHAQLIQKRRRGKKQMVSAKISTVKNATQYLNSYEEVWSQRFESLDSYLIANP